MYNQHEKICLVIPCYNESKRLNLDRFANNGNNLFFLFVNDGSTDCTLELLTKNLKGNMFLLNLESNCGKGEAVRRGILHIKNLPIFNQIDWFGFWDADLATPLEELNNFILFKDTFYPNAEAIFGSRIVRLGSSIVRSYKRSITGRFFATFIGLILGIVCYDSQCGAKLFRKDTIDRYFNKPFVSRWIFDVEILLRMNQKNIAEYALCKWTDVPGGSLKIFSVAVAVLKDVLCLRKQYL
jgi:glycosyltransferase involved in cell wall biosynthesis